MTTRRPSTPTPSPPPPPSSSGWTIRGQHKHENASSIQREKEKRRSTLLRRKQRGRPLGRRERRGGIGKKKKIGGQHVAEWRRPCGVLRSIRHGRREGKTAAAAAAPPPTGVRSRCGRERERERRGTPKEPLPPPPSLLKRVRYTHTRYKGLLLSSCLSPRLCGVVVAFQKETERGKEAFSLPSPPSLSTVVFDRDRDTRTTVNVTPRAVSGGGEEGCHNRESKVQSNSPQLSLLLICTTSRIRQSLLQYVPYIQY